MHTFLYSIIPFIFLIVLNSLLIYYTLKKPNKVEPSLENLSIRRKRLSLTIAILTLGFIITTIPSGIITGFLFDTLNTTKNGKMVIFICDSISFTYHSGKFLIMITYNSAFKQEFKSFIGELIKKGKHIKRSLSFISRSSDETNS